jgi:hypothetical protein
LLCPFDSHPPIFTHQFKQQTHTDTDHMSLPLFDASKCADISLSRNILDVNKRAYSRGPTRKRRKKKPIKRIRRKVAKGAPTAPLNFLAAAAATEIVQLTWDDPQDKFLTYTIERRQRSEIRDRWTVIKAGLAGNTYLDKNCFVGVTYHYRIFATDEAGRDGHVSKPVNASSASCFVHFKRLWNRANTETDAIKANPNLSPYERFSQLLDNLCLVKAFQASRQGDPDVNERESRISAVFDQTKVATEELIISDAFAVFAHLQVIPTYLHQKGLPKDTRDVLLASLRPDALREAFDVFEFAGIDLLKTLAGYIYTTACRKLVNVIASDKSINSECEHNSKAERAARANGPSKSQRFSTRIDAEAAFNGQVRVIEFAEHTDATQSYESRAVAGGSSPRTPEEKAAAKQFKQDNAAKERGLVQALDGTFRGYKDPDTGSPYSTYTPDEVIVPDESRHVIPQVITSAAELADASPRDFALSYELVFNQVPDVGKEYLQKRFVDEMTHGEIAEQFEGSSDKKSVRRIERLGASTLAQAKATLVNHKPPGMTANLIQDAFIELHRKESEMTP